ncbi:MAG: hypothetical protein IT172_09740 [Acidobacteria bacterium]|nr:hypothetical protein [Acidobacteriota bacterium]
MAGTTKKTKAQPPQWSFPKNTLEEAITVAKAIEDKHGGNPMKADLLAKAVGFNLSSDWRFQQLLKSANLYGLVSGSGATATVTLEEIGQNVVAPASAQDRKKALLSAFTHVEDFKKVDTFYGTKRIPEDEYFLNTLTRQFSIPRDRAEVFADIFRKNIRFLSAFDIQTGLGDQESLPEADSDGAVKTSASKKDKRVREFLDTCFVMMPFGGWFDRYYQDIYVPAIKEAGLEPVRADELFSTGSVMEQIWDQISKARVLLADLTDKNPNVFYELGLAHAARKPVVFTTSNIEDVPFDLRHLRVIVYEVREPNWAEKLGKFTTEYLRNTIKDPAKSIPHPFRNDFEKSQKSELETEQD